ncbi:hypothetical protein [Streptomyces purpureus]|uniref:Uncharacterized protein n=1 Tax=Streptomyces purpureus TaxID=1951 RepID=A0A918LUU6_9ACTN|nr:hypothetical protein [Streptomyces purpureus]GGT53023.1 hypothetical protein GCM10014713_53750 [Streptomyces purpureus]
MSGGNRREEEVRRMLDGPHPQVPADLAERAAERGSVLLHRHRLVRRTGWLLLWAAAVAFVVWASVTEPWVVPPAETSPPLEGW